MSLVITIIIMLILAGVVLSLTLGNNGIFKTAKRAAENYTNAEKREIAELDGLVNEMLQTSDKYTSNASDSTGNSEENINTGNYEKLVSLILNQIYPVGSIYISTDLSSAEEVSAKFGGTWENYGEGRTLVGTTANAQETGGQSKVTLTVNNLPSHSHEVTPTGTVTSTVNTSNVTTGTQSANHTHSGTTGGPRDYMVPYTTALGGNTTGTVLAEKQHDYGAIVTYHTHDFTTGTESTNHTHTITAQNLKSAIKVSSTFTGTNTATTSVGEGSELSVQDPYITVYMWKRVK